MTTHEQLLGRVRHHIGELHSSITWCERLMREVPSIGPFDIEPLRVALWRLRRGERILLAKGRYTN